MRLLNSRKTLYRLNRMLNVQLAPPSGGIISKIVFQCIPQITFICLNIFFKVSDSSYHFVESVDTLILLCLGFLMYAHRNEFTYSNIRMPMRVSCF